MSTLFDIFGFSSLVLHGAELVAQSVVIGSVSFVMFVVVPLARRAQHAFRPILRSTRRVVSAAVIASLLSVCAATVINATVLAASSDLSWRDIAGAGFVVAGGIKLLSAAVVGVSMRRSPLPSIRVAVALACLAMLAAAAATSHAAARLNDSTILMFATGAHELGAALWLGGLPCFALALRRADTPGLAARIGRRFSAIAITGVALIVIGAAAFAVLYVGDVEAIYGTAYGAMATTKSVLFGMLLLLGLANFRLLRRSPADRADVQRVRRFVEIEMGIGIAVLMAAASITSLPPAVDLDTDRVTWNEIVGRMRPTMPRWESPDHAALAIPALQARLDEERHFGESSSRTQAFVPGGGAPPPRNAYDVAWSEYNHHWAGVLVILMGIAALAQRSGHARWARHWPLLFLLMAAFLFLRADAEVWPMGSLGLIESLKDPEVVQHRIFVVLIVAFALFEWSVRTGRIASHNAMRVFPLATAVGATLLVTHTHALGNVKEELLIEMTHLPIGVLGITAGWARWLEVEAPEADGCWAGWLWPVCFVLIGMLLVFYREA